MWCTDESNAATDSTGDYIPSLLVLAPPPEATTRIYNDYLFAELRWLAEDYKRERQWKKVSAKRVCLNVIKKLLYDFMNLFFINN